MVSKEVDDIHNGVTLALCRVLIVPSITGLVAAFFGSVFNVGSTGDAPWAVPIGVLLGVVVCLLILLAWPPRLSLAG